MDFTNLLIGSDQPDRLVEYYTKLFGKPGWNDGGYAGWIIGRGGITSVPHDQLHGKNAHPGRIIWNIESDDVKADCARLKDAGAIVVREPYTFEQAPGSWVATLADPDDN